METKSHKTHDFIISQKKEKKKKKKTCLTYGNPKQNKGDPFQYIYPCMTICIPRYISIYPLMYDCLYSKLIHCMESIRGTPILCSLHTTQCLSL